MQIVVTGACTALGQALLRAIVERAALTRAADGVAVPVRRVIAVDRRQPAALFVDARVEYVCGNFEQARFLARVMGTATDSIFHCSALGAAAGAGPALDDLDQALLYGLDTTRALLDACQFQSTQARLVLASSRHALPPAGAAPGTAPATADGVCLALCETYLVECARRGLVDLRTVRLPCVVADRSCADGIALDEQLAARAAGERLPGADTAADACTAFPVILPADAAAALLAAHELPRQFPLGLHLLEPPGARLPLGGLPVAPRTAQR